MSKKIYLDFQATTPVDEKILKKMLPFFTENFEGFDINKEEDWLLSEQYIDNKDAKLQNIDVLPFMNDQ